VEKIDGGNGDGDGLGNSDEGGGGGQCWRWIRWFEVKIVVEAENGWRR
jgi:hypothetical protein